ncbi:MAG: TetR/AcrR family transcriptional regulator [Deltaproteobacteria bacterium]|nr:TetR/AcrR family transcriptional regulator [Deltaproteobacteria bacterium]
MDKGDSAGRRSTSSTSGAKRPSERPGQPGGRRDTNRRERTKALSDAALALFLERGIEAVTIEDITSKAGVAKGSFYRYFDDKQALVEALFAPVATQVIAAFDESIAKLKAARSRAAAFASYEAIGEALGAVILHHGDVVLLYLQECRAPAEGARAPARLLADVVAEKAIEHTRLAREHGLLRAFPAEVSTLTVIGAAERILFSVLNGDFKGEPLEVPGQLITLIFDGLRAPDLRKPEG